MWILTPKGFISVAQAYDGHVHKADKYLVKSKFSGHIEALLPDYSKKIDCDPFAEFPYSTEIYFNELQELLNEVSDDLSGTSLADHPDLDHGAYRDFIFNVSLMSGGVPLGKSKTPDTFNA